jgi:hypothetical protein
MIEITAMANPDHCFLDGLSFQIQTPIKVPKITSDTLTIGKTTDPGIIFNA